MTCRNELILPCQLRDYIFKLGYTVEFVWSKMRLNVTELKYDDNYVFDAQNVRNIFQ